LQKIEQISRADIPVTVDEYGEVGGALESAERKIVSGQYSEALETLDWVAQSREFDFAENASVEGRRGWCLENLGRCEEAAAAYRAALRDDAGNPELLAGLGNVLWSLGDRAGAAGHWMQVADMAGDDATTPRVLELAGWSLYRLGRLDEAEHAFRRAIEGSPMEPSARFDLGLVLLVAGRGREARQEYERAVEICTSYPRRDVPAAETHSGALAVALEDLVQATTTAGRADRGAAKAIALRLATAASVARGSFS